MMNIQLRFVIPAHDANRAFDLFDETHAKAKEGMLAKMNESRPRIARV